MDSINLPFLLVNFLLVVDPLLPLVLLILPSPILLLFPSPTRLAIQLTWDTNTVFVIQINGRTNCPLNKEFIHTLTKKNSDTYGIQTSGSGARNYCYQLVRSRGMAT